MEEADRPEPIHVQVARAVGRYGVHTLTDWDEIYACQKCGSGYRNRINSPTCAPRFDTDWSATGPLIEKYGVHVFPFARSAEVTGTWCAGVISDSSRDPCGHGASPLIAVCNLILKLSKAGKL